MALKLNSRTKKMFINLLKDPERKSLPQIIFEFSKCSLIHREIAGHYFTRLLYKKGADNYMDYITNKEMWAIVNRYKDDEQLKYAGILANKILFYLHYGQSGIRIPVTLAYNNCEQITVDGNNYQLHNQAEFGHLLEEAMRQHGLDSVFVKPAEGHCGQGCAFLTLSEVEKGMASYPGILEGSFLFQEPITQHQVVSAIYPYSLNTLRFDTFIDSAGNAHPITCYMRFGVNGRTIDNSAVGGCWIGVDIETGYLKDKGYHHLVDGARRYDCHPTTKASFKGVQIPYFQEAKEMSLEAARLLPYRLTGWDIGIAPDGPVLIEGNSSYHVYGSEMCCGGFRNHPVYREVLREFVDTKGRGKIPSA